MSTFAGTFAGAVLGILIFIGTLLGLLYDRLGEILEIMKGDEGE